MRLRVLDVPIAGLPQELEGLRVAHLSDFHLGPRSRGVRAVERAVEWVAGRDPELVCITGDLLSRPQAAEQLNGLLARLRHPYVVLGNHDYAVTRDPRSRVRAPQAPVGATLLVDRTELTEARGVAVEVGGIDARTVIEGRRPDLPPSDAPLRILLCHFPAVLRSLPPGRWQLLLAGHLHAGQIVLPYGFGKLMLAHPRARVRQGLYERNGTVMHVSPGLGTTFVPLRFFARPEATELVLRCA